MGVEVEVAGVYIGTEGLLVDATGGEGITGKGVGTTGVGGTITSLVRAGILVVGGVIF